MADSISELSKDNNIDACHTCAAIDNRIKNIEEAYLTLFTKVSSLSNITANISDVQQSEIEEVDDTRLDIQHMSHHMSELCRDKSIIYSHIDDLYAINTRMANDISAIHVINVKLTLQCAEMKVEYDDMMVKYNKLKSSIEYIMSRIEL
jgi:hypothetical protein